MAVGGDEVPSERDKARAEDDGSPDAHGDEEKQESAPAPETVHVRAEGAKRSATDTTKGRELLETAPGRTGSDLLRALPGVFVTQHSGEGKAHQIFLRGYDAAHGQDVEITVGGLPVNEVSNLHGQGYADLHFVIPEVVSSLRVTYGAADPRQGDFAVAGSIAYTLGMEEPGFLFKGSVGSFGTKRLFAGYRPKGAPSSSFAAMEVYDTDGFGPNRAAGRASLLAQHELQVGERTTLRLLGSFYGGRFDSPGVVREEEVDRGLIDRFATYDPSQGGASRRAQLLTELSSASSRERWSIAPFFALRALTLLQNYTGYLAAQRSAGVGTTLSDATEQRHDDTLLGLRAAYQRKVSMLSERDTLEIGFYGRGDFIQQAQALAAAKSERDRANGDVDARVRAVNLATYLDAALHPLRRVVVRGGLRVDSLLFSSIERTGAPFDVERSAEGVHVGKKLSVDVALGKGVHGVVSYGDGFRSPQARSLANGERTPFVESKGVELGARGEHDRVKWSLAAFYTALSRDLVFDERTARNEAAPATRRIGVGGDLTAGIGKLLTTSVGGAFTVARFTASDERVDEGSRLPYVPELVLRADVVLKRPLGRIFRRPLEGRARYGLQGLFGRPLPYGQSGHDVLLLEAGIAARAGELELALDAANLLDAKWYDGEFYYASNFRQNTAPSLVPARHASVGAPRSLFASLIVHLP